MACIVGVVTNDRTYLCHIVANNLVAFFVLGLTQQATVTNTGKRTGDEVVFAFIRPPANASTGLIRRLVRGIHYYLFLLF